jgi:hypothetical protein
MVPGALIRMPTKPANKGPRRTIEISNENAEQENDKARSMMFPHPRLFSVPGGFSLA